MHIHHMYENFYVSISMIAAKRSGYRNQYNKSAKPSFSTAVPSALTCLWSVCRWCILITWFTKFGFSVNKIIAIAIRKCFTGQKTSINYSIFLCSNVTTFFSCLFYLRSYLSGNQSAYLVWAKSLCVIEAWISWSFAWYSCDLQWAQHIQNPKKTPLQYISFCTCNYIYYT